MNSTSSLLKYSREKKIKCVVWDLDNTVWKGVLLEDNEVTIQNNVVDIIEKLDRRGILNSIASKNEYEAAMSKLSEFGISEYFLYPQINWNSKSLSIKNIAESLNINADTIAFVDDQTFERDEVNFVIPEVLCIDTADMNEITDIPCMNPTYITEDSKNRRFMYISDMLRKNEQKKYCGENEEFLATLGMQCYISEAKEEDLKRAEELTVRTNQLNTTGYTYSFAELNSFRKSDNYKLLIASLSDKYGTYGKIGLALIETGKYTWNIKLLLMSCRVMSTGVGTIMLNYILNLAKKAGTRLLAEFVANDRNRMMYITFKFAGFKEISNEKGEIILENDLSRIQQYPEYIKVVTEVMSV